MRFRILAMALLSAGAPSTVLAEAAVKYSVVAAPVSSGGVSPKVRVTLSLPEDARLDHASLIMPRAIPMGYGQQPYDEFVTVGAVRSRSGALVAVARDQGPRWKLASATAGDSIAEIDYDVDLLRMETVILPGGDSSRSRDGFISLLGYSVFAYVEGLEARAVELHVAPPSNRPDWPVFSTLAPKDPPAPGRLSTGAADFYGLADSQVLLGRGFRVRKLKTTSSVDLFMAIHAEGPSEENVMAPLAEQAFEAMVRYFGSTPFPHFTLLFDYLEPLSPRHTYGFSMEHMQSATFGALASAALTSASTERERASWRYNVAHHVSHAWIPKRCAGEGYFPFRWELAPLIDTIWLSEGFGQYAAADALSDVLRASADGRPYREALVENRFRAPLRDMPAFLKQMPLVDLSRVASTVYSEDFRTGRTVFARGGLMAYEMDERIRAESKGGKRLRDAMQGLVSWSAREKRGFRIDELPGIVEQATGVETRDLMEKWLSPMR